MRAFLRKLRGHAAAHPRVVDGCVAALVAALSLPSTLPPGAPVEIGGVGWLWFVGVHAPLVWRRRAPVIVFWASAGLMTISDLIDFDGPYLLFVPLVAIYAVARYRPPRYLWPAMGLIPLVLSLTWWRGEVGPPSVVAGTALAVASGLLGITTRTRRAYLAQLEERARRLEHERDQQARLAVAAERARIAREMHDIVAHNLAVMVALADGATFTAATAPRRAAEAMAQVSTTGRQALSEMRRLVGLLREDRRDAVDEGAREPQPGLDDIDRLVAQVRAAGLRVVLTREGVPGAWGPGAGLAVYRIVQEALTNTLKHAGPHASAEVRLRYAPTRAEVEVIDDGGGRPVGPAPVDGRHGLTGMRERAASYGGRVEAGPAPSAGWRVHAHLRPQEEPA
jgi:signal transduction histidine kinase